MKVVLSDKMKEILADVSARKNFSKASDAAVRKVGNPCFDFKNKTYKVSVTETCSDHYVGLEGEQ